MGPRAFVIERRGPGQDRPRLDSFTLDVRPTERVLDALMRIKDAMDGSLAFRRSCGHGICGSCAMNINGRNGLACRTLMQDLPVGEVRLGPLPALPVIRDLVVDMDPFFRQNAEVMPYLIGTEPPPPEGRERLQSPGDQGRINEATTCIMCGSCTTACPSYWANPRYLGPSALLKAYRFAMDSRDGASSERMKRISGPFGVWRCHSVMNCVEACPKGIDIGRHLAELKRRAGRAGRGPEPL